MSKIITIGSATQDIFIESNDLHTQELETDYGMQSYITLQEGSKIEVKSLNYHTGGGATNSATSFARLGFSTTCCIKIGSDDSGTHIIQQLKQNSIIPHASIDSKTATGTSFILPTKNHDRVVLCWRGANTQLTYDDIPPSLIEQSDALYITSLTGPASYALPQLVKHAKKYNKMVITNPGTSQLSVNTQTLFESLPYIDILVLNNYETDICMQSLIAEKLAIIAPKKNQPVHAPALFAINNTYDIKDFFISMLKLGPSIIAVTNGKEGVYLAHKESLFFHHSLPTHVVNTLGAGDAFSSAFSAAFLYSNNLQKALLCGLINAKSVIEHLDAKTGLLTQKTLEEKYAHLITTKEIAIHKYTL